MITRISLLIGRTGLETSPHARGSPASSPDAPLHPAPSNERRPRLKTGDADSDPPNRRYSSKLSDAETEMSSVHAEALAALDKDACRPMSACPTANDRSRAAV